MAQRNRGGSHLLDVLIPPGLWTRGEGRDGWGGGQMVV